MTTNTERLLKFIEINFGEPAKQFAVTLLEPEKPERKDESIPQEICEFLTELSYEWINTSSKEDWWDYCSTSGISLTRSISNLLNGKYSNSDAKQFERLGRDVTELVMSRIRK